MIQTDEGYKEMTFLLQASNFWIKSSSESTICIIVES